MDVEKFVQDVVESTKTGIAHAVRVYFVAVHEGRVHVTLENGSFNGLGLRRLADVLHFDYIESSGVSNGLSVVSLYYPEELIDTEVEKHVDPRGGYFVARDRNRRTYQ